MATILIVDDERLVCDLLGDVLADAGHEVVTAYEGAEAIRSFVERRPAVTILDLELGKEPAFAVLRELRQINPDARIVGLTGAATLPETEDEARGLGVEEFLSKNLDVATVVRYVAEAVLFTGEPARSDPRPPRRAAHILIADDDPGVRQVLCDFLLRQPERYRISTAVDGQETLDLVMRDRPDLVLLDLKMPAVSGIECLRRMAREAPAVGVIAISGVRDEALVRSAIELGCFDFLAKPLDFEQLGLSIRAKLALMEGRRTRP